MKNNYILDARDINVTALELQEILQKIKENSNFGEILWGNYAPTNQQEKKLFDSIDEQLSRNNDNYTQYPSDLMHGLLCMHTSSQKVNTEDKIQLLSVVWEVLDAHVSGLSALFANDRDKQLVLAFNSIQTGEISFEKCNQLTQSLIAISQSNHYNLSFTGYLNGAQLAEYCNYLCSGIIETKAVLFNSPGITKKHDPKNLVNYLGKPNIFNSLNSHNGKIYRLFTLAEDDSVRFQYLNVLKQKHGDHLYENMKNCDFILESIIELSDPIERLNKILDQFDADTGKPFYCEEVKGWPLLKINPAKFYQTTLVSSLIDQKRLTFSRNDSIKSRKELIKEAMKKESIDRRNSKLGSKEHLAEKNRFSSFRDSVLSRKKPNDKEKKKDSKMSQSSRISGLLNNLKSKQNKKERKNSESSLSHNSIGSPVPNQNSPTLSTYTQEDNFQEEIKYPEVLYNIEYILKIVNELIKELFEFVSFEKETYTLKLPKNEEAKTYEAEFLHFINDYQTEKVNWFEDLMNIEYPNNDWCLNALTDFNIDSISSEECKQLMEIIVSDYSIKKKENSFLIVSHLLSIESIRNKMTRLKLLMPELPELMSNSANKENFSRIRNNLELMEYQFVGREAIIQRCKFLLERDQGIIINGESGTGKTRLANQLGIMFKKDYIVRVMNSESSDKLEKDYREFAELLLKMNSKVNDISMLVQMVNSKLRSHHFNFIFIFDNMTDWNLVSFFLIDLPFHKVNVIITTKYPELTNRWAPICLGPFDTNESNEYLINNIYQPLTQQQNNEIIRLAKLNDEKVLPIELYLTARYINEYLTEDIRIFLKSFEAERSIYHMLAAKLRKESLETFQLFKYCCHMDADFISFSLLKHLTSTDISTFIIRLKNYGFVQVDYRDQVIRTHRIIQHELKGENELEHLSYIKEIAHALFEIVLKNKDSKLIEHDYIQVKKVLNIISEKKIIAAIPYEHVFTLKDKWANYCLTHKQNYAEALDEYLDLKKFLLSTKEDEEAENASTIYGIACSYYGLGDYDKALSTHLKCCKQRENLLEEDPIQLVYLADSYSAIGETYFKLNNLKNSIEFYLKALDIRRRRNLDRANILNGLGKCYTLLNDFNKALEYFTEVYKIREKLLDSNHPELAQILFELGNVSVKMGAYEESYDFHFESLKIRENLYASDHPDLAYSLLAFADSCDKEAMFDKALEYNLRAYEMRKNLYRNVQSLTLSWTVFASNSFRKMNKSKKPKTENEESNDELLILNEHLNPILADSVRAVGFSYFRLGQSDMAFRNFNLALKIRQNLFIKSNLEINDLIESYVDMAKYHAMMGDDNKFLEFNSLIESLVED